MERIRIYEHEISFVTSYYKENHSVLDIDGNCEVLQVTAEILRKLAFVLHEPDQVSAQSVQTAKPE